jgi:hypothetical protein
MMAITTNNSISVNPRRVLFDNHGRIKTPRFKKRDMDQQLPPQRAGYGRSQEDATNIS